MEKVAPKSKTRPIFLKICAIVNLIKLGKNLTLILYLISMFRQIGPRLKISSDVLENFLARPFEGVKYRSDMDILRFFIQNLYLDGFTCNFVHEPIWKCQARIWDQYFCIIYLKYKFEDVGPRLTSFKFI